LLTSTAAETETVAAAEVTSEEVTLAAAADSEDIDTYF
jgi:hypothetical protein